MNFQYIKKIEGKKVLLDIAFGAGKSASESAADKNRKNEPLIVKRRAEQAKIDSAKKALVRRLDQILEEFPNTEELPKFYKELLTNCIDEDSLKKSLNAVRWCRGKIASLHKIYSSHLAKARDSPEITKARKGFYGRVSSLMERTGKNLLFLDSARKTLKQFPDIKPEAFTIAVTGYPNVGKSSLLSALTGAKPKVADYAFTTTTLNVGYMEDRTYPSGRAQEHEKAGPEEPSPKKKKKRWDDKIQVIDVPGTFDRKFSMMNIVEKQAVLVISHLADAVVFILDPTETCGYSIGDQLMLLSRVKGSFPGPIVVAVNKSDISDKGSLEDVKKGINRVYEGADIVVLSAKKKENLEALKRKIYAFANNARVEKTAAVYEPGRVPEDG